MLLCHESHVLEHARLGNGNAYKELNERKGGAASAGKDTNIRDSLDGRARLYQK